LSFEAEEARCAAGATAPPVSLDDIKAGIALRIDRTGDQIARKHLKPETPIAKAKIEEGSPLETANDSPLRTLCVGSLALKNRWIVVTGVVLAGF
jgi:hypothetical protein